MHFQFDSRGCHSFDRGARLLQTIIRGGTGLLQMVIQRGWPLENDDPEGPASCKWSSGGAGLLQMIIQRAAVVRRGIGDSSSWMKIDFFLIQNGYYHIIRSKEQKKSEKTD